jgi:hypothetical protein
MGLVANGLSSELRALLWFHLTGGYKAYDLEHAKGIYLNTWDRIKDVPADDGPNVQLRQIDVDIPRCTISDARMPQNWYVYRVVIENMSHT